MSALAQALLAFQKSAPAIQRDALNPHFRNKYVSLETLMGEVVPKLNEAGLVVSQFPTAMPTDNGPSPALRTRITHAESGEFLEDVMLLMPGKTDPQGQGSAITYARRYSLMAMLALVADEDDDGNSSAAGSRPGTDELGSSSPAAEAAARAHAAFEQATGAVDIDHPSKLVIHFGKNKGTPLSALSERQLEWYATQWKVQDNPSEYDIALKEASIALLNERRNLDDLPFA